MSELEEARRQRDLILGTVEGVPHTSAATCRLLFDLVMTYAAPQVIEVACCFGRASVVLAKAAAFRGGYFRAVDREAHEWEGLTAIDRLRHSGLLPVSEIVLDVDAHWYLLDLLSANPTLAFDLAFIDAAHTVEVDAFISLAIWNALKPGGVMVFDDLEWIPTNHDLLPASGRADVSHVRAVFEYICLQHNATRKWEWGGLEQGWPMGLVMKRDDHEDRESLLVSALNANSRRVYS